MIIVAKQISDICRYLEKINAAYRIFNFLNIIFNFVLSFFCKLPSKYECSEVERVCKDNKLTITTKYSVTNEQATW